MIFYECYECFDFGGKVGGREFLWLVNFLLVNIGLWFDGILGGMGGGDFWVFLFGFLGGIGGVLLFFWVGFGNFFNVIDLGGNWGGLWGIFGSVVDICWWIGEVIFLKDFFLLIEIVWGFVWVDGFWGGMLGGGFFFGKFLMLM